MNLIFQKSVRYTLHFCKITKFENIDYVGGRYPIKALPGFLGLASSYIIPLTSSCMMGKKVIEGQGFLYLLLESGRDPTPITSRHNFSRTLEEWELYSYLLFLGGIFII